MDTVLIASPLLLFALAFLLVVLSEHFGSHAPSGRLVVLESFWRDPTVPPVEPRPGVSS